MKKHFAKTFIAFLFIYSTSFSQVTFTVSKYSLNMYASSIDLSDINNDGATDIVSINWGISGVVRILNDGTGSFGSAATSTGITQPEHGAIVDYNGDGQVDVITCGPSLASNAPSRMGVHKGNIAGTFSAAIIYTIAPAGERIMRLLDVDQDGNKDLVVAEYQATSLVGTPRVSVFILPNNGTILQPVHYPLSNFPTDICITDLNNDSYGDVVVTIGQTGQIAVLLGDNTGTFGSPSYFTTCSNPTGVAAGDFNGDGKIDIVAGNANKQFAVMLGQGDGNFNPKTTINTTHVTELPVTADLNADGRTDIAFGTDSYSPGTGIAFVTGNGNGTFAAGVAVSTGSYVNSLRVADLNNDGMPDLVGNEAHQAVVLLNTSPNLVSVAKYQPDAIFLKVRQNNRQLTLETSQASELRLTDITGRTVCMAQLTAENEFTIILNDLTPGIYIATSSNASGILQRKIIIE